MTPKRIMIFGKPGSGKSIYAAHLHQKLNLPLYHLDKYFFTKNWQERDTQEFLKIQQNLVNQDKWIIDGNCLKSLETRYQRADICLYFNHNKWHCLYRLIKRRLKKPPHIQDRAKGCKEILRWQLIKYLFSFESRIKDTLPKLQNKYPQVKFFEIKKDHDLKKIKSLA